MAVRLVGDWKLARAMLANVAGRTAKAVNQSMLKEANFLRGMVVKGIRDQAPGDQPFKPLSPTTLAIRKFMGFGGRKALIRSGYLLRSIQVYRIAEDKVFIGVHRTAKGADGKSLVRVAELMEYGSRPIVIHMTPKMRRFLFAAFHAAGLERKPSDGPATKIIIVQIPARPFLRPTFQKYAGWRDVKGRFVENMRKLLGVT